ncbi:hypothetical protein HF325_001354 [Metschnikowia pulcherrima]|uniref:Major facilitator superfamily (MFS) profile domain-containing protein n=1 Tax=Metschnikowia pulcherrima TaxID=27326 RepID=A0A8H7GX46_9ASCO|nr:hypothetical protein HF325_001354 [Metschnikowia pulcherrima]
MSDLESLASSVAENASHHQHPRSLQEQCTLREKPRPDNKSVSEKLRSFNNEAKENSSTSEPIERKASLNRHQSAASMHTANRVSRSERRGLLSSITILPEFYDPKSYLPAQKLTIVAIVAFAAVSGPMGTTILLPAVNDLSADLDTGLDMVNISVGIYLLTLGIFPLWWSNFSERHGRRSVYVLSFALFFAFSIGCALAPSIDALIVLRLMSGIGASAVQSCGAGTISDLYIQEERGTAIGLFFLGPLLGPFLSPIIGGAVAEAWGWRASMWVMTIVCGLNLVLILFLLPETLPRNDTETIQMRLEETLDKDDNISEHSLQRMATNLSQNSSLRRQMLDEEAPVDTIAPMLLCVRTNQSAYSQKLKEHENPDMEVPDTQKKSWLTHAYDYVVRPMHSLVFLTYPPVLLLITYSSLGFMGVYFLSIAISNEYGKSPYNFTSVIVGLMYIPNSIATILTSIYGGRWNDWLIKRSARRHNGELRPESRLSWNIVLSAVVFPPACMIFAWCLEKKQHWTTPLIGSAMIGFSSMIVMGTAVTYLVDVLPGKGATGVALNNLVRQVLAAIATFITEPVINAVGVGVLFCIYAGVVTAAALAVFVLKKRGAHLREKYDITAYYSKL